MAAQSTGFVKSRPRSRNRSSRDFRRFDAFPHGVVVYSWLRSADHRSRGARPASHSAATRAKSPRFPRFSPLIYRADVGSSDRGLTQPPPGVATRWTACRHRVWRSAVRNPPDRRGACAARCPCASRSHSVQSHSDRGRLITHATGLLHRRTPAQSTYLSLFWDDHLVPRMA